MNRIRGHVFLAFAILFSLSPKPVSAGPPIYRSILPNHSVASLAELVVIGKVTNVAESSKEFSRVEEGPTQEFWVATFEVKEVLLGSQKLKEIRVGFPSIPNKPKEAPVTKGKKLCLSLDYHLGGDFYTLIEIPGQKAQFDPESDSFEADYQRINRICKICQDPLKSLTSERPPDRLEALYTLTDRYRNGQKIGYTREVTLPVDVSKHIMLNLAELPFERRKLLLDTYFDKRLLESWKSGDPASHDERQKAYLKRFAGFHLLKKLEYAKTLKEWKEGEKLRPRPPCGVPFLGIE